MLIAVIIGFIFGFWGGIIFMSMLQINREEKKYEAELNSNEYREGKW